MTAWTVQATFAGSGGMSFLGYAQRALQPDADSSDGLWTDQTGGTNLNAQISEMIADDSNYIQSSVNPVIDVCKISLSDPSGSPTLPISVQYRYKKTGTSNVDLKVRLLQGTTEIAAWLHTNIGTSFLVADQALTSPQFAAISDFTNLFLEFTANPYLGPGDVVSGATAWWGLRAYSSVATGSNTVRLRRDSDNTEQDFVTLSPTGALDTASITSFKGAANLFVVKLYDQAGTNDMVQATAANQPTLTTSPVRMVFGGGNQILLTAGNVSQTRPWTKSVVAMRTSNFTSQQNLLQDTTGGFSTLYFTSSANTAACSACGANQVFTGLAADNTFHTIIGTAKSSGTEDAWVDSTNQSGTATGVDISGGESYGSGSTVGSSPLYGQELEAAIWPVAFNSAQGLALSANQLNYWFGSYTGPGDIVGGATAWWGLRGYARGSVGMKSVRLRRDSDNAEQDFLILRGGALDVASITTFKGGANLFVVKLYDQAGTNDMAQATSANQPSLTLSGIGSLPIMTFDGSNDQLTSSMTASQPLTMSVVAIQTPGAGQSSVLTDSVRATGYNRLGTNIAFIFGSSQVQAAAAEGSWHALHGVINGASSSITVDGSAAVTGNINDSVNGLVASTQFGTTGALINGSLTEGGVWPSALSSTNISNLSSNQHSYWGF